MADAWLSSFQTGEIPITLTTPIIFKDGGYVLEGTLGGIGLADGNYELHVGPLSTSADPICYSGVSGQGEVVIVANNQFSCISPILPLGGPYAFTFVNTDTRAEDLTQPVLTAVPQLVRTGTLAYRGLLPRVWHLGFRTTDQLDFPQARPV